MRELVYLSDAKLRQFLPEPRRFGRRGTLRIATPFGGFDLEPSPDPEQSRLRHLQQVMRRIDVEAEWFMQPDVRTGQWVQFEAPLNLVPMNGSFTGMALFIDPAGTVEGYERSEDVRLILHGSVRHVLLMQSAPALSASPPEGTLEIIGSGTSGFSTLASFMWMISTGVPVALAAEELEARQDPLAPVPGMSMVQRVRGPALRRGTFELIRRLDRRVDPETAVWMRGCARVTANLKRRAPRTGARCVVASPLYVEYAPDLP
ncbi:SAVMC3_10250 family protein [Streptomyces ossamyceticus]|uniref:SAVMC3_10250 family protein n=1 Tax=Streptomyces ossamyceticus TaxID=249581 RepID=UPI0036E5BB98